LNIARAGGTRTAFHLVVVRLRPADQPYVLVGDEGCVLCQEVGRAVRLLDAARRAHALTV
jgi:hypothetical protein